MTDGLVLNIGSFVARDATSYKCPGTFCHNTEITISNARGAFALKQLVSDGQLGVSEAIIHTDHGVMTVSTPLATSSF